MKTLKSMTASILAVLVCGLVLYVTIDVASSVSEISNYGRNANASPITGKTPVQTKVPEDVKSPENISGDFVAGTQDEWELSAIEANSAFEQISDDCFDNGEKIELTPLVIRPMDTRPMNDDGEDFLSAEDRTEYTPEDIAQLLADENRTYYFDALEGIAPARDGSIFQAKQEKQPELLIFDSTYASILRKGLDNPSKKREFLMKAFPPDSSISKLRNLFVLWKYILSVSKHAGTPPGQETALIEAAALIWYSTKYGAPLGLAVGVAQTESLFMPTALSYASARGVMQVMWSIHYGLLQANGLSTYQDLHDPELGIAAGCLILSRYLRAEASVAGGLRRYYGELSTHYVGKTQSHWHAFELFSSGVSKNWKATLAREKTYWDRMLGNRSAMSIPTKDIAKYAPETGETNGSSAVRVSLPPSPKSGEKQNTAATTGNSIRGGIVKETIPTTVYKRGGIITITYGNGSKKVWTD